MSRPKSATSGPQDELAGGIASAGLTSRARSTKRVCKVFPPNPGLAPGFFYARLVGDGECGCRGRPVGRRGQRQDRRLAVRAGRRGRAFPGRAQCRPHARHRRQGLQAVASALRRRAPQQALGHRQRRGARSACTGVRSRAPERAGRRHHARQPARGRERHADPLDPPRTRRAARERQRRDEDRHDQARHRPGL